MSQLPSVVPEVQPRRGVVQHLQGLLADLRAFPWKNTALTLRERFREDRLGLTASSLTFTTIMALVPLVTVALAVFTAFPMFHKFENVLQKWLLESLVPDSIARQVMGYLTQFSGKASKMGAAGLAALFVTALALILTIDRTLNSIWRVRRARPFGQKVLVYWAAVTLGPVVLAASLTLTSYALSASKSVVGALPGGVGFLLDVLQFFLMAWGVAAMYRYVPHTWVRWGHAWVGGLFVSAGFEIAKKLLTLYLTKVPTVSAVYGAFATVPILLGWIYVGWVIVLWGAVIAAYLPSLLAGVQRRATPHGFMFQLALETLQQLAKVRTQTPHGLTAEQLGDALRVDELTLEAVLETLTDLNWIGRLDESEHDDAGRYVLLVDPASTVLAPLVEQLLLQRSPSSEALWTNGHWPTMRLSQAIAS